MHSQPGTKTCHALILESEQLGTGRDPTTCSFCGYVMVAPVHSSTRSPRSGEGEDPRRHGVSAMGWVRSRARTAILMLGVGATLAVMFSFPLEAFAPTTPPLPGPAAAQADSAAGLGAAVPAVMRPLGGDDVPGDSWLVLVPVVECVVVGLLVALAGRRRRAPPRRRAEPELGQVRWPIDHGRAGVGVGALKKDGELFR